MFCTQCRAKNAPEAKFCTSCGHPMGAVPIANNNEEPQASGDSEIPRIAAEQPSEEIPSVPSSDDGAPSERSAAAAQERQAEGAAQALPAEPHGAAASVSPNRKLVIGCVVAAVALVAAVIAGIVTYNLELWGGKTLPDVTVPSASVSRASKTTDAKVVVKQLEEKGFSARTVREFSGLKQGTFLGYRNADAGSRVRSGSTVTVRESAGPGVPKGTIGKKAEDVVKTFSDMGVPVHYKQVTISDSNTVAEGSVVSTSPAPGQGMSDAKDGIYIGVATKDDDGLPSDIVGQNIADVKTSLESKGYVVKVKRRLSSRKYVGKVSGSQPGPGSQLSEGQTITLYQGVDAKGAKQSFIDHSETSGNGMLTGLSDVAVGQWCTKAGDCITLGLDNYSADTMSFLEVTSGGADTKYSMTGQELVSCDAVQQSYCSNQKADYLLTGDSGAFELFPIKAFETYWCGDSSLGGEGDLRKCVAGNVRSIDSNSSDPSDYKPDGSGKYRMMDLFAVFPVGSDVESVEDDGYFDASALAAAKKQKAVDTDRPFLMYRDASQYKESEKESSYTTDSFNPFLPYDGYNGSKNAVTKMKPAPSDETAYYLVEDTQPDWDSLEDADVAGASSTKTEASGAKKDGKTDQDSSSDAALFGKIAGSYVYYQSGDGSLWTALNIDENGGFSGKVSVLSANSTASNADTPHVQMPFHGRFSSIKKNDAGGYDMQCDASSFSYTGDKHYHIQAGLVPCTTWHWYPAGTPFDSMSYGESVRKALELDWNVEGLASWNTAVVTNDGGSGVDAYNAYIPKEEEEE